MMKKQCQEYSCPAIHQVLVIASIGEGFPSQIQNITHSVSLGNFVAEILENLFIV